jgi:hypothetical protein
LMVMEKMVSSIFFCHVFVCMRVQEMFLCSQRYLYVYIGFTMIVCIKIFFFFWQITWLASPKVQGIWAR